MIMPSAETSRNRLRERMLQAGFYQRHATAVFLGVKMVLMVAPITVGLLLGTLGLISISYGVILGAVVGLVGNVGPGVLMSVRKSSRQTQIRRALPDALDVIVICLEPRTAIRAASAPRCMR